MLVFRKPSSTSRSSLQLVNVCTSLMYYRCVFEKRKVYVIKYMTCNDTISHSSNSNNNGEISYFCTPLEAHDNANNLESRV